MSLHFVAGIVCPEEEQDWPWVLARPLLCRYILLLVLSVPRRSRTGLGCWPGLCYVATFCCWYCLSRGGAGLALGAGQASAMSLRFAAGIVCPEEEQDWPWVLANLYRPLLCRYVLLANLYRPLLCRYVL